jgi:hypothetical protein
MSVLSNPSMAGKTPLIPTFNENDEKFRLAKYA